MQIKIIYNQLNISSADYDTRLLNAQLACTKLIKCLLILY